ncbi:MAG: hypothetical protein GF387_01550 [Candidatus Portnoybacteria bacterium]|nr:hypothetical protein [Candidatus Portnoybacteria bacterium]
MAKEIKWKAPEFSKKEKTNSWFIIPAIITIILGIIALISDNFLFLITIILAFIVFYVFANKDPRIIEFEISSEGIRIDNKIYDFDEIKSFWIFYDPPEKKELSLRMSKIFYPYIQIPLKDQDPNEIREFLLKFIKEKRHQDSIIDNFMNKIGF